MADAEVEPNATEHGLEQGFAGADMFTDELLRRFTRFAAEG